MEFCFTCPLFFLHCLFFTYSALVVFFPIFISASWFMVVFFPINHIWYLLSLLFSIFPSLKHLDVCNTSCLAVGALAFTQLNKFQTWCALSEVSSESANSSCKSYCDSAISSFCFRHWYGHSKDTYVKITVCGGRFQPLHDDALFSASDSEEHCGWCWFKYRKTAAEGIVKFVWKELE